MTNFSPIQYVYDEKSPYFVEKSDIYQIKKNLCSCQDIHESLELSPQLLTLVLWLETNVQDKKVTNITISVGRIIGVKLFLIEHSYLLYKPVFKYDHTF